MNSPFIIEEKPEEDEKLNNILFEGINNIDKENILELEKHDGNNIRDLKILIRKLRVNSIIFKSNLGSILNKVTKERDFFLNKLKDIEYLYFNPIIKNTNENKNEILKSILKSQIDSTILINSEGIASIKPLNIKNNFLKNQSKDDTDLINTKINSQNAMKIRISISKVNKDKNIDDDIIIFQMEYKIPEFKIPIVEYNLFSYYGTKKISLSHCQKTKVNLYIPKTIENFQNYKYNPNDYYYYDKCSPYSNEDNIDLTIQDRRFEFNMNNMSLCESICAFKKYVKNYIK